MCILSFAPQRLIAEKAVTAARQAARTSNHLRALVAAYLMLERRHSE